MAYQLSFCNDEDDDEVALNVHVSFATWDSMNLSSPEVTQAMADYVGADSLRWNAINKNGGLFGFNGCAFVKKTTKGVEIKIRLTKSTLRSAIPTLSFLLEALNRGSDSEFPEPHFIVRISWDKRPFMSGKVSIIFRRLLVFLHAEDTNQYVANKIANEMGRIYRRIALVSPEEHECECRVGIDDGLFNFVFSSNDCRLSMHPLPDKELKFSSRNVDMPERLVAFLAGLIALNNELFPVLR
jgi:hypothetical protein